MHPPEADCFLQKTNLFYFFRSFFSDSESPGLTNPTRGSNPKESYLPIMRTGSVLGGRDPSGSYLPTMRTTRHGA
jgi:hypothetical protein